MRIKDLHVDGFGVWSGLELAELSPGLNVFYGPNESGKTTLMQFVRSIFFGFSEARRATYLPPVHPGRPGGVIHAASGDEQYAIARHVDEPGDAGQLLVSRDAGYVTDHVQTLTSLLGEVDETTFNNVFVFGLREIQELATLGDTRAAEELYSISSGLDRVSLVEVMRELIASRERLLATDDRPSLVAQLQSQRERLLAEIDELGQGATRYLTLAAELRHLDAEIESLQDEAARGAKRRAGLALARGLADRWRRRQSLDEQLTNLVGFDTLPEDALSTFERLESRRNLLTRRARNLKRKGTQLRTEIAELKINDALCRHAPRFEALGEQQQWIASLEKQVLKLEAELLELEVQSEEEGKQWGGNRAGVTLSQSAVSELRAAAREYQAARREVQELEGQSTAAEETVATVESQIEEALGASKEGGLTEALAEAGQLVADLRHRVHLDERITQMTTRQTELEEQSYDQLDQQIMPAWALIGLGCAFVLGCALVLLFFAGLVMPAALGSSLGSPMVGLVGLGSLGLAGGAKLFMDRGAAQRLDASQQQAKLLEEQLRQAKAERDELDAHLPRGGGALVSRLQAAERSLARLEELLPLDSQRESARSEAESATRRAQAVRDRCQQARRAWRRLLSEYDLPADLSPRQLKAFAVGRRQVAALGDAIADKKAELGRCRTEYDTLAGRIEHLVGQVGVVPRSKKPLEQLQQVLTEWGEQQSLLKERRELSRRIARLRKRHRETIARRNKVAQKRVLLLRAAGTLDDKEFRRRAALQADARRLETERAQLEHEITSALAGAVDAEEITAWLGSGQDLAELERNAAESESAAAERLGAAQQRRGEMNHGLTLAAQDNALAEKQLELSTVEQRLAEAVERWHVLAVCNLLLDAVRVYYEREHQPRALVEASGYLKRLTSGRYVRVWTPLGEPTLYVEDDSGHSLGVQQLSSGTREQLFLALRLALASSFARRGVSLPLVLDDVLVNFDVARSKSAARVLRDFARRGHQLLVFTCHEHIARLFRHVKAEVRHLPDHTRDNAAMAVPRERPRRERPPSPPAEEPPVEVPDLVIEPIALVPPDPVHIEVVQVEPVHVETVHVEPPVIEPVEAEAPPPRPEPKPAPTPARRRRRRRIGHFTRRWSAEEFDGELADRVRRDLVWDEEELEGVTSDDDSQAA